LLSLGNCKKHDNGQTPEAAGVGGLLAILDSIIDDPYCRATYSRLTDYRHGVENFGEKYFRANFRDFFYRQTGATGVYGWPPGCD
jgi:hypothetical protein